MTPGSMKYLWRQSSNCHIACVSNPGMVLKLHQDVCPCRAFGPYAVLALSSVPLKHSYVSLRELWGFTLCSRSSVSLVCLSANQSDPHLISSKRGCGGSTLGFNPAKSTQWALTSFCSFLFSFITLFHFYHWLLRPPSIFSSLSSQFLCSVNFAEPPLLPVSKQTGWNHINKHFCL